MLDRDLPSGPPESCGDAIAMVLSGLGWLAGTDVASVPVAVQVGLLRDLERAESLMTAARAGVLSAFDRQRGFEGDGQGTAKSWLRWQTKVSKGAAAGAVGWMRRLRDHRLVAGALARAAVSASWARYICQWTDALPSGQRDEADEIMLQAVADGADLHDLAVIAEELRSKLAEPEPDVPPGSGRPDGSDPLTDGQVWLATTTDGAGRLEGDLSPGCAAALKTIFESLGKKAGPEDSRTIPQRNHDALQEACRRLVSAGGLPDRAGQPTQIQLHIGLDELLRRFYGGAHSGPGGRGGQAGPDGWPPASRGEECDAQIVPIVTGALDHDLLDRLAQAVQAGPGSGPGADSVRDLIAANAMALLSGPKGLASWLRRRELAGVAGSVSLPLDTGASTETIPAHLRRLVILRDRHCAAPGCDQPPAACQVHHLRPRSQGGLTKLTNLLLLCSFHHLTVVHKWGWQIALNVAGTTTMTSPNGDRVYHSHSPPAAA